MHMEADEAPYSHLTMTNPRYEGMGYLADRLEAYVRHHRLPGNFLRALLSNNLYAAVKGANQRDLSVLPQLMKFLDEVVPAACWGSSEKVEQWLKKDDAS